MQRECILHITFLCDNVFVPGFTSILLGIWREVLNFIAFSMLWYKQIFVHILMAPSTSILIYLLWALLWKLSVNTLFHGGVFNCTSLFSMWWLAKGFYVLHLTPSVNTLYWSELINLSGFLAQCTKGFWIQCSFSLLSVYYQGHWQSPW